MGSETVKVIEESRVDGFRGLTYLHVTENMTTWLTNNRFITFLFQT